jgi:hypothetical protein
MNTTLTSSRAVLQPTSPGERAILDALVEMIRRADGTAWFSSDHEAYNLPTGMDALVVCYDTPRTAVGGRQAA